MPEINETLYAMHAQGPDSIYAASSKEDAEAMTTAQNEQVPLAKCIVIVSPWAPVDHWKTLAEQNADDAKYLRAGWIADIERNKVVIKKAFEYLKQAGIDAKPESVSPLERLASEIDIALSKHL